MNYSISKFGEIPYDQVVNVQVIATPEGNEYGCLPLEKPEHLKAEKFVWILKRGMTFKKISVFPFLGFGNLIFFCDDKNLKFIKYFLIYIKIIFYSKL